MEPSWQHSCPGCTKPGFSFQARHKIRCDTSQDRKDQGHPHVYTEFRASLGYNESLLKTKTKTSSGTEANVFPASDKSKGLGGQWGQFAESKGQGGQQGQFVESTYGLLTYGPSIHGRTQEPKKASLLPVHLQTRKLAGSGRDEDLPNSQARDSTTLLRCP